MLRWIPEQRPHVLTMFTIGSAEIQNQFKDKSTAIVTTTTIEYVDMAVNWFLSLKRVGLDDISVVVCYDRQSYDILKDHNIPCGYLNVGTFPLSSEGEWYEMEKRVQYRGAQIFLDYFDLNLVKTDSDIFFFKNFVNKLAEETILEYDVSVCSDKRFDKYIQNRQKDKIITLNYDRTKTDDWGISDQVKYGELCGSISYIPKRSRDRVRKYIEHVTSEDTLEAYPRLSYSGSAQAVWNDAASQHKFRIKKLSVYDFPNGSLWKVPYLQEAIRDTCYSIHYNFHSHAAPTQRFLEKRDAMIHNNHWLL